MSSAPSPPSKPYRNALLVKPPLSNFHPKISPISFAPTAPLLPFPADTPPPQAGALSGTTVDLALYPLDTLKTRLQSLTPIPTPTLRSIYAGVGSALLGSAPGAALFFVTYESIKTHFPPDPPSRGPPGRGRKDAGVHVAAASLGEVAACTVRVPTEVVKQRAQALQHPSSLSALSAILTRRSRLGTYGLLRELYRGFAATLLREIPFTAIQFPLWEFFKSWRRSYPRRSGGLGPDGTDGAVSGFESAVCGALAGAVAACATTPLDVVKTRLMLGKDREGMRGMVGRMWREEGGRVFLSGVGPRVVWISAGGAIFLGSYQWAYNWLEGMG